MVDLRSDFFSKNFAKPIMGVPNRSNDIIEEHLQRQAKLSEVTNHPRFFSYCDPPDRLELSFAIVQNGRFHEFLNEANIRCFPLDRLDDAEDADGQNEGALLPPIFIFHGEEDSAVPATGTKTFVEKFRERRSKAKILFTMQPGDHGFDGDATLRTPWLAEGLKFIGEAWPKT